MANSDLHCPSESYTFDSLGRLTNRVISGTTYLYTYGSAAHVDAPTAYHGNSYSYDAVGSQLTGTVSGVAETRSFDPEDRLAGVVTTGGTHTTSFVYDGNGKRVLQTVSIAGTTTSTLYVGNLYEEQLTGTNHPSISYYFLGGKLVGLRRANQANSATNGQYRLVGDHLGSVSVLVDTASPPNVVQRAYYKPYGEMAYQYTAQSSLTSVNYTGQRLDSESGLLYYGARYYDPVLSYFISGDTATPDLTHSQSFNHYSYVLNDPLRYIDPTGYGPNDYYVFVTGCVLGPTNDQCTNVNQSNFGGYVTLLHNLFTAQHWTQSYDRFTGQWTGGESWETWSHDHLITFAVSNLDEGAAHLSSVLGAIPGNNNIHLFGGSQGGAAILQYFADSGSGPPQYTGKKYQIDPRIASFVTIDSPVKLVARMPGDLGAFLRANTRIKTGFPFNRQDETALNVTVPGSAIASLADYPIRDIDYKDDPNFDFGPWGISGFARHVMSGGAATAPDVNDFLYRVWR